MKTESVRIQHEMGKAGRSTLASYQELIIGQPGFWRMLKYELVMLFCSIVPGALGLFLRSLFYPCLLSACGKNVNFGANVVLRHPHKIKIGNNVIIDDNCLLDAKGRDNEGIVIGAGVFVGRNSILSCKNGDIILHDRVNIGFNSEVFSGSRVEIGNDTLVAAYCYFVGGDHAVGNAEAALTEQGSRSQGITVGANCWFGAGAIMLDGIRVGANAIVGAGAVVTKDVSDYAVSIGVPARQIRDRRQPDKNAECRRQNEE